jgi:putative endonuclease
MCEYHVYIMANKRNGTLYVGMTNKLTKRVRQHKNGTASKFMKRDEVKKLVYYEGNNDTEEAVKREKELKKWNRQWKMRLVDHFNPEWKDLYRNIIEKTTGSPTGG